MKLRFVTGFGLNPRKKQNLFIFRGYHFGEEAEPAKELLFLDKTR